MTSRGPASRVNGTVWIALVLVVGMLVASVTQWRSVFGWSPVLHQLIPAIVAPVVIAVAFVARPRASISPIITSLVALWCFLAVAVLHDGVLGVVPTSAALHSSVDGLVNGWSQIISVPLPATGPDQMMVLPVVASWVAALASAELVVRSTHRLAAALPPTALYGLALSLGVDGPGSPVTTGAVLLVLGLLLAAVVTGAVGQRPAGSPSTFRWRQPLEAGVCLVVVGTLGVVVGPRLPLVGSGRPYDPRTSVTPPVSPVAAVNPLAELAAWARNPGQLLFTVHSRQPLTTQIAVLGTYSDLNGWTGTSRLLRSSAQVTAVGAPFAGLWSPLGRESVGSAVSRIGVSESVTIQGLQGSWVPVPMDAVTVSGIHPYVDAETGMVQAVPAMTRGATYHVVASAPRQPPSCIGHSAAAIPVLASSPQIERLTAALDIGAQPPCQQAEDLLSMLATGGRYTYSTTAPSGTNIAVLENFLYGPASSGRKGTSEQFAGAFALLARTLGLPARVVVGFHAGTRTGSDTWRVTGADAFAFAEVDFDGLGWVGFDPTPLPPHATPPPDEPAQGQASVPGGHNAHTPHLQPEAPVPPAHTPSHPAGGSVSIWMVIVVVVGGLVIVGAVLGLLVALVRRSRRERRERRRQGTTRQRVLGAWLESRDALSMLGVDRSTTLTAREVVDLGSERLSQASLQDLDRLAALTDAALFAQLEPTEFEVQDAWDRRSRITDEAQRGSSRWQRVTRVIDLRELVRRS